MMIRLKNFFILDGYHSRLAMALNETVDTFSHPGEKEWLQVCAQGGHPTNELVLCGAAHKWGVIHRTSDVILVCPDGRLVAQRRTTDAPWLASSIGLSAGGHLTPGEDPLTCAIRELQEEMGIAIEQRERFHTLHSSPNGLPLFYREWTVREDENILKFTQFDPLGPVIQTSYSGNPGSESERPDQAYKTVAPSAFSAELLPKSELLIFNQEMTYYYLLFLRPEEFARIKNDEREVSQIMLLTIDELNRIARNPVQTTDSLSCVRRWDVLAQVEHLLSRSIV